ncbi:hypothetical protein METBISCDRAFT_19734 [Metschnikowia bicuspidata]|uniref:Uncharacterized protein n=1 Tax=Metschnikowia bicuspidata TaxID=27322 RepID=A0A4P9ZAD2_9ASCO|nr:hypothetical protein METBISCDRAFT_19734 [Metschnikowia bicuspidata]
MVSAEELGIDLHEFASPEISSENSQFDSLSYNEKLSKLQQLVQKSQIYSQIILDNMLERSMEKKQQLEVRRSTRSGQTKRVLEKKCTKPSKQSKRTKKAVDDIKPEVSKETASMRKAIEAAQTAHNQQQPALVTGCVMKDFQLDGLEWLVSLYENGLNGILAHEMGLGKTLQCIALYSFLIENKVDGPFLVVAPLSTIRNWGSEFRKFAPEIDVIEYAGAKKDRRLVKINRLMKKTVVITSYELVMKDFRRFAVISWGYLTVDEGHRLKNFQSILIQTLKKLKCANRLLLTGTPLQNNLLELWSLLNFILPDIFHDLELFERWFNFDDIANSNSEQDEKLRVVMNEKLQQEIVKCLHIVLKPFMLRRVKQDVMKDLPPKKEYIIYSDLQPLQQIAYHSSVERNLPETFTELFVKEYLIENEKELFSTEQDLEVVDEALSKLKMRSRSLGKRSHVVFLETAYDAALNDVIRMDEETPSSSDIEVIQDPGLEIPKVEKQFILVLKAYRLAEQRARNLALKNRLMTLRNICGSHYTYYYPFPVGQENSGQYEDAFAKLLLRHSGKMQLLDQLLERLLNDKHKVLIFSQFTGILDLIQTRLESDGISTSRIDGNFSIDKRKTEIENFSHHGIESSKVFLISTRAGGLGLNLTDADTVIIFDNDWNPQIDLQAIGRVHRIGQTKPVKVFRFAVRNTIEEIIIMRSFGKRALEQVVIRLGDFQLSRVAKKLKEENIDISAIDTKSSFFSIGECHNFHGLGLSGLEPEVNKTLLQRDDVVRPRLLEEEMEELMDRSPECYARETREFPNILSFVGMNNLDG